MDDKIGCMIVGILSLTLLECVALLTSSDGAFFLPIVGAISGLCGFAVGYFIPYKAQK